ncbi:hypothetical protein CDL12_22130 [Handroanthus impetiginosus]|uniref:Uncharacterized protein n=1 Tax=Handroanthus impetiginosus TaxID=429701 RepID=A0A2G9GJX7_9LAMI|nr:hypothetical protein CDL12_22130 [Handroanthus impetiginosus]
MMVTHTCGSINFEIYRKNMVEKYGDNTSAQLEFDSMLWINTTSSDGLSCNQSFGFGSISEMTPILINFRDDTNTDQFQRQSQRSETSEELVRYKEQVENLAPRTHI